MATETREVKYSYKEKEFKIVISFAILFITYLLLFNQRPQLLPSDESDFSVIIIIAILWANDLIKWIIWKLAGGWKE